MTGLRTSYRWLHIVIWLGAVPFLAWMLYSRSAWSDFCVAAYVLTAYLVAMLIISYPGSGNRWYRKVIVAAILLHGVVLLAFALGALALIAAGIKAPTLMFFGLIGAALALEWRSRLRLFELFMDKDASHKKKTFSRPFPQ